MRSAEKGSATHAPGSGPSRPVSSLRGVESRKNDHKQSGVLKVRGGSGADTESSRDGRGAIQKLPAIVLASRLPRRAHSVAINGFFGPEKWSRIAIGISRHPMKRDVISEPSGDPVLKSNCNDRQSPRTLLGPGVANSVWAIQVETL